MNGGDVSGQKMVCTQRLLPDFVVLRGRGLLLVMVVVYYVGISWVGEQVGNEEARSDWKILASTQICETKYSEQIVISSRRMAATD